MVLSSLCKATRPTKRQAAYDLSCVQGDRSDKGETLPYWKG